MTNDELREHLKDREWRLDNIYAILNVKTGETRRYKRPIILLPRHCGKTVLVEHLRKETPNE